MFLVELFKGEKIMLGLLVGLIVLWVVVSYYRPFVQRQESLKITTKYHNFGCRGGEGEYEGKLTFNFSKIVNGVEGFPVTISLEDKGMILKGVSEMGFEAMFKEETLIVIPPESSEKSLIESIAAWQSAIAAVIRQVLPGFWKYPVSVPIGACG